MRRAFRSSVMICFLILTATIAHRAAAQGTTAVTVNVYTHGDSVRAFAAALYDRNNTRLDSAVAAGNRIQFVRVPSGVPDASSSHTPAGYWLGQNYPNPFNPSTHIRFQLAATGVVTLQIFDVLGRTVGSYTGTLQSGVHDFEWNAGTATGVYFYRILADGYTETKKMIRLDGGGIGGSTLREIGAGAAGSAQASRIGTDGDRSDAALKKVEAYDYSIKIYNLLQTDPQIIDTVVRVSGIMRDTSVSISPRAAERTVLVPIPASMEMTNGSFELTAATTIVVDPGSSDAMRIGQFLAEKVHPATGYTLPVVAASGAIQPGTIFLTTTGTDSSLGDEGYTLTITPTIVTLAAYKPAGLFHGVQTIRQMFPPAIEDSTVRTVAWKIQTGTITDRPRFAWRGVMQDISRHFFGVADLKHLIDYYSYYKLNTFHLHLTDSEAWNIEIKSWPDLAPKGRKTGQTLPADRLYLTQAQYTEVCSYAQSRYMTIVPEIDLPGHFDAAITAYPQLSSAGSYWKNPIFYSLLNDVFRELSLITPGRYIHIGGDEAYNVPYSEYIVVVDSVQKLIQKYGKYVDGWEEIGNARILPHTIVQHWNYPVDSTSTPAALRQGAKTIISRANKLYLDQKYTISTPLGLMWAGFIEVKDAYSWDPALMLASIREEDIAGVESPLWAETTARLSDVQFLAFPRVIGHAEIGWSPKTGRNWEEYAVRLGYQGLRLRAMGINFYRSPQVPWK